ncbi:VRR-NUC domain-containing protein [Arthrobacter sp. B1805]|uniref:VRR-NUC domain-containing protein n=1 Tax=Arthrobacter sp. B1805 TaxID=2058892 RepID=UPI000CE5242F|nr:VRR-NUC domain-containing protein [Arthrobacter sp. B1805]
MTRFPSMTSEEYRLWLCNQWTESQLQGKILQLADELHWLSYHTHDSRRSRKGWPDLFMIHVRQKRFLVWELKSEKGKTTIEQRAWIAAFAAIGIEVEVLRPADWASGHIERQLRGQAA